MIVASAAMAAPIKILALGDSLTAGYGLAEADGFCPQLEKALKGAGHDVQDQQTRLLGVVFGCVSEECNESGCGETIFDRDDDFRKEGVCDVRDDQTDSV